MTDPFGGFTEEALAAYQKALAEQAGTDFAEGDSYDFTTCIRPDGSAYGTGGKCRKGSEGEAKKKGKTEQSTADKAMEMVKANARSRGLTEIKAGGNKPATPASTTKKPAVQGYDWRKQSGTFRKANND